jgi:beta-glucanase (GH16 family)
MDSPNNVSVSEGTLVLTTRKESRTFTCQVSNLIGYQTRVTSGSVTTFDRFAQAYGRFEVRAKFTGAEAKGLQSALWLWPQDPDKYGQHPKSGEIDFAEIYNGNADHVVPYIHYNNEDADPDHTAECAIDDFGRFHDYVVEWTPASIKISYDGVTCLDDAWTPKAPQTGRQPFDQPFIMCLTQGLGVQMTNAYEPANTPLPASTVIDYVRVYQ